MKPVLEDGAASVGHCPEPSASEAIPLGLSEHVWLAFRKAAFHRQPFLARLAILVAHPDDEVIGAGAQLSRFRNLTLVHVTDGSPRNLLDATAAGFSTREAYARRRRMELQDALALAGQASCRKLELGLVDQESALGLVELTSRLVSLLQSWRFDLFLTHPYEGGHPDHDSVAFALQTACELLRSEGKPTPCLVEMASYHSENGRFAAARFLPSRGIPDLAVPLREKEQELKSQMFCCFATQQQTLRAFSNQLELFRPAPRYDFSQPPHAGPLYYEMFNWGMTGARWRTLARETRAALGLEPVQ